MPVERIVTDEIRELYSSFQGSAYVVFNVKSLSNLRYHAFGLGVWSPLRAKDWDRSITMSHSDYIRKFTGGLEGCFQYNLRGYVQYPIKWKGFECVLDVKSWTEFSDLDEMYRKGFIGDGIVSLRRKENPSLFNEKIYLNVYVKSDISREILEKLYIFNKVQAIFSVLQDTTISNSKLGKFIEFFLCWNKVREAIKAEETLVLLHIANLSVITYVEDGETPILRGDENIYFNIVRLSC